MRIIFTPHFKKALKRLHQNQKKDLDSAVQTLIKDPFIGEPKTGKLSHIRVYKFKMTKQLTLLAYKYKKETITLTLLELGSHENFYRDLEKRL